MPVETTEEYHRIRIKPPGHFHRQSFRTISLGEGIKAVIGCPKTARYEPVLSRSGKACRNGTQVQTLLFDKKKYSKESAKTWVKNHPKIRARRKK